MIPFVELTRVFRELTSEDLNDASLLHSSENKESSNREVWADLLRYPRVLLLAEAGSGKTREMREQEKRLNDGQKYAFFVPLEALRDQDRAGLPALEELASFKAWKADGSAPAWFFLDSVDELKLMQGTLAGALSRFARCVEGCLHRIHVVMSCRPTDWLPVDDLATYREKLPITFPRLNTVDGEIFLAALGVRDRSRTSQQIPIRMDVHTVVLLPLREHQIELFAHGLGVLRPDKFLAEIRSEEAEAFARLHLDCRQLAATWKATGRLGTRTERHEISVTAGLTERPGRAERGASFNALTDRAMKIAAFSSTLPQF
jgi:hypothetical protein